MNSSVYKENYPIKNTYICSSKNKEIQQYCGSAGCITEISRYIIKNNGIVYGVRFSDDFRHGIYTRVDNEEDLKTIMGVKYFEPDCIPFEQIENDLTLNKTVLFIGCPCKTLSVINRYKKFDNLITISFICNSIPTQENWEKYVDKLEKENNSKLESINFKHTIGDFGIIKISYKIKEKTYTFNKLFDNEFMKNFLKNNNFVRQSCLSCNLRYPNIQSDFIVGDSWGFENKKYGFENQRTNLCFCMNENSNKILLNCELFLNKIDNNFALNVCKKYNSRLFKHR